MLFGDQVIVELLVSLCWILYYLAITTGPGSPPRDFIPVAGEWRRWCGKCQNFKPPRSHHCKSCDQCILVMDHHCPWTMNCVGFGNLPHFIRFLSCVIIATGYVTFHLIVRAITFYHDRNMPAYLIRKSELAAVIVLIPISIFLCLSIGMLLIRCIINYVFKGMSQIEVWEWERIELQFHTERMWSRIRRNYQALHRTPMPELESAWPNNDRVVADDNKGEDIVPAQFTIDDLIFPYDYGIWQNLIHSMGYIWLWALPWGKPPRAEWGYKPEKSVHMQDDQLDLPWPPDGGHQEVRQFPKDTDTSISSAREIPLLRRRLDPRSTADRLKWTNDMGEGLDDYGVDVDLEEQEEKSMEIIGNP